MSDRMDDVLASIDAELTKCICGQPIPEDGVSLDYCSDVCQYRYTAERVGAEPSGNLLFPLPPAETDGRVINAEVNRRFQPGVDTDDPWIGLMDDVSDRLREAARQAELHLRIPDTRHAATFERREHAPESIPFDQALAHIRPGDYVTTRFLDGRTTRHRVHAVEGGQIIFDDDSDQPPARISVGPPCPAAPTLAELDSGTDLTAEIAMAGSSYASMAEAGQELARAGGISTEEMFQNLLPFMEAPRRTEPLTGEDFRRRALEHQQNRGTGPPQRRQRLPRDHRR